MMVIVVVLFLIISYCFAYVIILRYGVDQKKVNFALDQLETCGFLPGVQHVSNNTSVVILDIAKF